MKQLIEFNLPDESVIFVEVEEPLISGPQPVASAGRMAIRAQKTFAEAFDTLKPVLCTIKEKFDQINQPADEVEVKFGLKLSGKCGAVIVSGAEASFDITLRWTKK